LDLALDQSDKNPVFKIQYAHARMCSIFRKAEIDGGYLRRVTEEVAERTLEDAKVVLKKAKNYFSKLE